MIAEFAPEQRAAATLVVHAHHDAAHTGLVFHPAIAKLTARVAGPAIERIGGTPAPMWGAALGPALVAAGAALRLRWMRRCGAALSVGHVLAMRNTPVGSYRRWRLGDPPPQGTDRAGRSGSTR